MNKSCYYCSKIKADWVVNDKPVCSGCYNRLDMASSIKTAKKITQESAWSYPIKNKIKNIEKLKGVK